MQTYRHFLLRRCRASNHDGRRMLNLHLMKENIAILGQLDLPRAVYQHLESAAGAKVRLHYVLKALRSIHVYEERLGALYRLAMRIHTI